MILTAVATLRRAARWAGLVCVPVLIVLSLTPADHMVRTGASGRAEHFLAYAGTGLLLGLGFYGARSFALTAAGLALLSGVMEIGQIWVPGRHPAVADALVSSAGAWAGVLIAYVLSRGFLSLPSVERINKSYTKP